MDRTSERPPPLKHLRGMTRIPPLLPRRPWSGQRQALRTPGPRLSAITRCPALPRTRRSWSPAGPGPRAPGLRRSRRPRCPWCQSTRPRCTLGITPAWPRCQAPIRPRWCQPKGAPWSRCCCPPAPTPPSPTPWSTWTPSCRPASPPWRRRRRGTGHLLILSQRWVGCLYSNLEEGEDNPC